MGLFQLSFSCGVPVFPASIRWVALWDPSVHWVNQWHSSGIPVYTGPASVHRIGVRELLYNRGSNTILRTCAIIKIKYVLPELCHMRQYSPRTRVRNTHYGKPYLICIIYCTTHRKLTYCNSNELTGICLRNFYPSNVIYSWSTLYSRHDTHFQFVCL